MKKNTPVIQISQPCAQSWEDMKGSDMRRACDRCAKQVIDLTEASDEEILSWFQKNNGQLCGRFRQSQLNRPLITPRNKNRATFSRLLAGLLFFSATETTLAEAVAPAAKICQLPGDIKEAVSAACSKQDIPPKDTTKISIHGTVKDDSDKPVDHAFISLQGTTLHTNTNSGGYFELIVTAPDVHDHELVLVISHKKFTTARIVIEQKEASRHLKLKLSKELILLGESRY